MTLSNDVYTELFIDDTWVDISTDVQVRDDSGEVSVKRGRSNESSNVEPATCEFEINNRDGQYSPRNPLSDYFGLLGRNTPVRVGLRNTEVVDTFDNRVSAAGWGLAENGILWSDIGLGGSVVANDFIIDSGVGRHLLGAVNAFRASILNEDTTLLPLHQRYLDVSVAVTFSLQVSNVTGGPLEPANIMLRGQSTTDYYLARVQVETDESVTVSIRRENAGTVIAGPVTVPGLTYTTGKNIRVRFEARGTTLRVRVWDTANSEPTTWTLSTTSSLITKSGFIGVRSGVSATNTNALTLVFSYDNFEMTVFRFTGEISTFPQKWDVTGEDAWVPVEAAGILRRLNQGNKGPSPGLKQYIQASTTPSAYWPLDDGSTSTSGVNLVKPNNKFLRSNGAVSTGSIAFGNGDLGATMDKGLSISYTGETTTGYMYGYINGNPTQTDIALDFLYKAEKLGAPVFSIYTKRSDTGAVDRWKLDLEGNDTGNNIELSAELDILPNSSSAVGYGGSAVLPAITDGLLHHIRFLIEQDGADIDLAVFVDGESVHTATETGRTLGSAWYVDVRYLKNDAQTEMALGHITVYENANVPAIVDVYESASSHNGETAGDRFTRLCDENDVASVVQGTSSDSIAMGPQYPDNFLDVLAEVQATDMGQLFETRDYLALTYRLRTDLYNQDAQVTVDFSDGELGRPLEPVDDDQNTRNDIFAQRREGSSYQATLETGALSVQEPPNGVGRYKDEVQVNPQFDHQLPNLAGWLLSLGTIDEARYPSITINLHNPNVQANSTLLQALLKAEIGDRLVITTLSSIGIYDDISVLILGYRETFNKFTHTITFNCVPYSPYLVAIWGTDEDTGPDRYDTAGSSLTSGIDDNDTSFTVTSVGGSGTAKTLWTTNVNAFPFDIYVGGERMTVGGISSTTSPQTFSPVTRSVNGVVKSHEAGVAVRLWKTPRYAL